MQLSICIPTVTGREESLNRLLQHLQKQVSDNGLESEVEIIVDSDNKEVSIGTKRDRMYRKCLGKYAVQIDDDDRVADDYVKAVYTQSLSGCDCIGYQEHCTMDGVVYMSNFSLDYSQWAQLSKPDKHGFTYHRTPFTKSPIRTSICQKVGVKDMRFGEDHDFAKRVLPYLRSQDYIGRVMYYYTYNSMSLEEHKKRFGIKK